MANPTPLGNSCFPVDLDEIGCHAAVDIAQALVAAGVSALTPLVTGASASEGVQGIVSLGRPFVWPLMPYTLVAAWFDGIDLMVQDNEVPPKVIRRFKSELWLPGFPTVRAGGPAGTDIVVPDPTTRSTVGRNATIIGETWANGICIAVGSMACNVYKVTKLVPVQTADLAGWTITVETT